MECKTENVDIREHKVFTEFLSDVAKRCQVLQHKKQNAEVIREQHVYPHVPDFEVNQPHQPLDAFD